MKWKWKKENHINKHIWQLFHSLCILNFIGLKIIAQKNRFHFFFCLVFRQKWKTCNLKCVQKKTNSNDMIFCTTSFHDIQHENSISIEAFPFFFLSLYLAYSLNFIVASFIAVLLFCSSCLVTFIIIIVFIKAIPLFYVIHKIFVDDISYAHLVERKCKNEFVIGSQKREVENRKIGKKSCLRVTAMSLSRLPNCI